MEKKFDDGCMTVERVDCAVDIVVRGPYASLNRYEIVELITFLAEVLKEN